MGDVSMAEAFALVGERMGLEGNIETHDFMTAAPGALLARIRTALEAGRGRRLILCPSSGYMGNVDPTPQEIMSMIEAWRKHRD
jgi:uroporphyrinogen-III decarboxylase